MPLFAFVGRDGPRGAELRAVERERHLAGIEALARDGRVRHAGPLLDADGRPVGSLVVFEAEDLDSARAFAAGDPYVTSGVFASHEVLETRAVFPA